MATVKTRLGLTLQTINLTGGVSLPPTAVERFKATIKFLMEQDYASYIYQGTTPDGLLVALIGEHYRSRLVAMDPEDQPGILYLVKDDGEEPDLTQIEVEGVFCLGDIVGAEYGYLKVEELLQLDNYGNDRLVQTRDLRGQVTFD